MATLRAEEDRLDDVEDFLESYEHLSARRRGDAIIIESGPKADRSSHVRLRRVSVHRWSMEVADHQSRWEPTPYVDTLESLLTQVEAEFGWVLEPRD
jgi:hypothetical protein